MPNRPYLDASVQWRINSGQLSLEEPDYRSVVDAILSAGLATEVLGLISAGKEANVYLARYRPTADRRRRRPRRPERLQHPRPRRRAMGNRFLGSHPGGPRRLVAVGPADRSASGPGERTRGPSSVLPQIRSPDRRRGLCERTRRVGRSIRRAALALGQGPQTTFVIFARRSAASSVNPSSPRIVYRSLLTSCAWTRAWTTSSSVTPSDRAVVGAPMVRSASRTSCQFPAWRYVIMIVPTPHCSPCKPGFFAIRSRACENLCSLPDAGLHDNRDRGLGREAHLLPVLLDRGARRDDSVVTCGGRHAHEWNPRVEGRAFRDVDRTPAADAEREIDVPLADLLFSLADFFHRRVRDQELRGTDLARREVLLDDQAGDLHRRLVRDDQGAFPELQRLTDLADRMQGIMADDDISGELHRLRLREGLRVHRRQCVSPKPRPRGILYLKATTSFAFALIREGHLRTFKTAPALSSAGWSFP